MVDERVNGGEENANEILNVDYEKVVENENEDDNVDFCKPKSTGKWV